MDWYIRTASKTNLVSLGPLRVGRMVMGTGSNATMRKGDQSKMGKRIERLVQQAYDEGVRFFDTADMYGTHAAIGRALKGKPRDSYQVCTKVWVRPGHLPETERPLADETVERFLGELDMDYIDLVQMHCMVDPKWPSKYRKHLDALSRMKDKGLIKAHGASCHSLPALKAAVKSDWVEVMHARLNPYGIRMDAPPEKVVPLVCLAKEAGKGVIAMKLNGATKFDKAQRAESIRFALGVGADCLLMGLQSKAELMEFKGVIQDSLKNRNPSS